MKEGYGRKELDLDLPSCWSSSLNHLSFLTAFARHLNLTVTTVFTCISASPSPLYVKVSDIGRRTEYWLASFKVMLQVTSDLDAWTLLSSAIMIDCYSSAISLCLSLTVPSSWGDEEGDERMTAAVKPDSCVCMCVPRYKSSISIHCFIEVPALICIFFFCLRKWDRNRYANNSVVMGEQWWSWGRFFH